MIFVKVIDSKNGRFLRRAGPRVVLVVSRKIRSMMLKLAVIQAVAIPQEMMQKRSWESEVSALDAYGSQNRISARINPVVIKAVFINAM